MEKESGCVGDGREIEIEREREREGSGRENRIIATRSTEPRRYPPTPAAATVPGCNRPPRAWFQLRTNKVIFLLYNPANRQTGYPVCAELTQS